MKISSLTDQERLACHRLSRSENVGPATFAQLVERMGSASAAIEAIPELSRRGGLRRPLKLYEADRATADFDRAAELGARWIAVMESEYPEMLRQSPGPPPLICIKGNTDLLERDAVAVVGARNASAAGLRFAQMIAQALADTGLAIVSGLARGIDTSAHRASLTRGTIAVVAGGIDHIYPRENAALQNAICEKGLLISEMPPGAVPQPEHFPRRNRIIAGLALGTVIVEAARRSGSLTTARFANEAGRDVFAVPGSPLDPRCEGTNGLIRDGAHLCAGASDVLEVLRPGQIKQLVSEETPAQFDLMPPDQLRDRLYELLSPTPVDVDEVFRAAGASPNEGLGIVIELELAGRAQRLPGGKIICI